MNKHCDSVSIELAYDLMEKLGLSKQEFSEMCGIKDRSQFYRWERKGVMPQYRLSTLRETIHLKAKEKYDEIVRILYEEKKD